MISLAWRPKRLVKSWPIYTVNGYKFHTKTWSEGMQSYNYGVCVRGTNGELEDDFFGILSDIIELEYPGMPTKKLVVFKCDWFDNTPNRGTRVDRQYGIVEVKESGRYKNYDPFIFAQQVEQVYYTPYPSGHRGWLAVIKTKARSAITNNLVNQVENEIPYQDVPEVHDLHVMLHIDADVYEDNLVDVTGDSEQVDISLLNIPNFGDNNESESDYESESVGD